MGQTTSDKPDILIVTVTRIERDAVETVFRTESGRRTEERSLEEFVYYDFGDIGGARVWMLRSAGMGNEGATGSILSIQKAIKEISPQAIIMVGIAFGTRQDEHRIGDVLISLKVVAYESQKIGESGVYARGDRFPATSRLIQKFENYAQDWSKTEQGVPAHCGLILSGNKLVDNLEFRNQLIALEPEAIGGEMEGAGLFTTAYENHVDWILIKAISDWGDGNKGEDKDKRQTQSAANAARLTYYVLERGNLVRTAKGNFRSIDNSTKPEIHQTVEKSFLDEKIKTIEERYTSSDYKSAVEFGREVMDKIGYKYDVDDPQIELLLGKFLTFFSIALIYSEGTEQAFPILNMVIERLEKRDSLYNRYDPDSPLTADYHLVLGRAYNHRGYGYWMIMGCYGPALEAFHKGLTHFIKGKWEHETATIYDNLGRVYAQLGHHLLAEFLIGHGLHLRTKTNNDYRRALSLTSSAILHLSYGDSLRAVLESEKALELFKAQLKKYGPRGYGLALITKGRALRMRGSHWRYANDPTEFQQDLNGAIAALKEAEDIFSQVDKVHRVNKVDEDIRVLQTYKELGCVYRESFQMLQGEEEDKARSSAQKAKEYYERVISFTNSGWKYPLLYVDVCHDLAMLYFHQNKTTEAEEALDKIIAWINQDNKKLLEKIDISEDYWQNLGKIYSLKGDLIFQSVQFPIGYPNEKSLCDSPNNINLKRLEDAFQEYIQAAGYFGRFLAIPVVASDHLQDSQNLDSHLRFIQKLYDRLSSLSEKDLRFLSSGIYAQAIKKNKQDASWVERFFKQSFGLLLHQTDVVQ